MSRYTNLLRVLLLAAAATGLAGTATAATLTVDTALDADAPDGFCSLREAILAANDDAAHNECPAGDGPDRIVFALSTPAEIDLTADLPPITETLLIRGPGPAQLVIDGADLHRLLVFDAGGGWLGVERLTLYRGRSPGGADGDGGGASIGIGETAWFRRVGFVENRSGNSGGGLAIGSAFSAPTSATVVECLFLGNVAEGSGSGGGMALIGAGGAVRIIRSTFAENHSSHVNGVGGGIFGTRGTLSLESSTLSGNTANSHGGGVFVQIEVAPPHSAALIVRDSTITENLANADADLAAGRFGGDPTGDGGGIAFSVGTGLTATLELRNSIVARNFDDTVEPLTGIQVHPDVHCLGNVQLADSGFSLVGSNEGCSTLLPAGLPNAAGDWVGSAGAELDPDLEPLADSGGPTPTHRPAPNLSSPTVDQGSCPDAVEDQRGFGDADTRMRRFEIVEVANAPGSDACDIGAFEYNSNPRVDPTIFADGFEAGHTLLWTTEVP